MDWIKFVAVLSASLVMVIGICLIFKRLKEKNQGLGPNSLRAIGTVLFIPTLLILAISSTFETETLAALLGTVAGYVLSHLKSED